MTRFTTKRIELDYDLIFTMPFHLGTGLRSALLDRTVVRNRQDLLYVPGSTQKGVWREKCEQLERTLTGNKDLVDTPHNQAKTIWMLSGRSTMSGRIFGAIQYPVQLFFEDAILSEEDQKVFSEKNAALQTSFSTQVRLDRAGRTSVQGALYTSEFSVRNLRFKGNLNGWLRCMPLPNLPQEPSYSLVLLLAGLHMIERLGGNKSTGKGACTCQVTRLSVGGEEIKPEQWQSWLGELDKLADYDYTALDTGQDEEEA